MANANQTASETCDCGGLCYDCELDAKRAAEDAPDALDGWLYAADLEGDVECGR